MSKNNVPFNKLGDKIENTEKNLQLRIDKLSDDSVKKTDQQYYATKDYVLSCCAVLVVTICSAYWLLTPKIISSENKQFEAKLEKIEVKLEELLEILKK